MRSFSKVLCGLLSFAIGSAAADLAAGVRAYDNKEFAKAAGELMPLAEGGDSTAQDYIGSMNSSGKGCRRIIRLESSRNWYSAAAERGHAHAAAMFGWLFATGPNVPWHSEVPTDLMAAATIGRKRGTTSSASGRLPPFIEMAGAFPQISRRQHDSHLWLNLCAAHSSSERITPADSCRNA
jgi:TPR repeat protein